MKLLARKLLSKLSSFFSTFKRTLQLLIARVPLQKKKKFRRGDRAILNVVFRESFGELRPHVPEQSTEKIVPFI